MPPGGRKRGPKPTPTTADIALVGVRSLSRIADNIDKSDPETRILQFGILVLVGVIGLIVVGGHENLPLHDLEVLVFMILLFAIAALVIYHRVFSTTRTGTLAKREFDDVYQRYYAESTDDSG